MKIRTPILLLLGLCLAAAGCIGFAVGDREGAKETETDMTVFGGYFDGGPAQDYRFRGAASRTAPGGGRPPIDDRSAPSADMK